MKVIKPVTITPEMIISCDVPETDETAWSAATAYTVGVKCLYYHKLYECLIAHTNAQPDLNVAPVASPKWLDLGYDNRWKMLDGKIVSQTSQTNEFNISLAPGRIDTLAIMNADADEIEVTMTDPVDGELFSQVFGMIDNSGVLDYDDYFFSEVLRKSTLLANLTSAPSPYSSAVLAVRVTKAAAGDVDHKYLCYAVTQDVVWTTDTVSNKIQKIDATSGALLASYSAGSAPTKLCYDVTQNVVWVLNKSANTVTKLTTTGVVLGTYSASLLTPEDICYDVTQNALWIASPTSASIRKLNAATGALIGDYTAPRSPAVLTYDVTQNAIWGGKTTSNEVVKFNATNGAHIGSYNILYSSESICFDVTNNLIWAAISASKLIVMVNALNGSVVGTPLSFVWYPYNIIFDSANNSVWASDLINRKLLKINAATGTLTGAYSMSGSSESIAYDSTNNAVWAASYALGSVKFNASTGAKIGSYPEVSAKVGMLAVGTRIDIGETQYNPTMGMIDYSRKDVDEFGDYYIIERPYADRISCDVSLPNAKIDFVKRTLAGLRVTPAIWVGVDTPESTDWPAIDSMTTFGFIKSFSIVVPYPTYSVCNLEIEGLI